MSINNNNKQYAELLSPKDHTNVYQSVKSYKSHRSQAMSMESISDFGFEITFEEMDQMLNSDNYQAGLSIVEEQLQKAIKDLQDYQFTSYFNQILRLMSEKFSIYLNNGNLKAAQIFLKKAQKFLEKDEQTYGTFNQLKVLFLNNWACYYRKTKNIPEAINILDDALKISYQQNLRQFKGLTNLNMGVLMNQIQDHEAAYECLIYAVSELYNDYFNLNSKNNKFQKRRSVRKILISQAESQMSSDNFKGLNQSRSLLGLALYNLGIEEEYFCNYEKALTYFQQAEKIVSESQENADFCQQIQQYLLDYQKRVEGIQQQRLKKNIKINPLAFSYRDKCLSCVFNKQGKNMEVTIQNQFEEFQKEKEIAKKLQQQQQQQQQQSNFQSQQQSQQNSNRDNNINDGKKGKQLNIQENEDSVEVEDYEIYMESSIEDFELLETDSQSHKSVKGDKILEIPDKKQDKNRKYSQKSCLHDSLKPQNKIQIQKQIQIKIQTSSQNQSQNQNFSQSQSQFQNQSQNQRNKKNISIKIKQPEQEPFDAQTLNLDKINVNKQKKPGKININSNLVNSYLKSYQGQDTSEIQNSKEKMNQTLMSIQKVSSQFQNMDKNQNQKKEQTQDLKGLIQLEKSQNLHYSLQQQNLQVSSIEDKYGQNDKVLQHSKKDSILENEKSNKKSQILFESQIIDSNINGNSYNFKDTKNNNIKKQKLESERPALRNQRQMSQQSFITNLKPYKQLPGQLLNISKNSLLLNNNNSFMQNSFIGTSITTKNLQYFNKSLQSQNFPKILRNEQRYKYDNFDNAFPLLDNFQSQNAKTDLQKNPKFVNPVFFQERRREKSLPNVNQLIRKNNTQETTKIRNKIFAKKLFKDKAVLDQNSCDCILCKRIFGLPKNYITVYPYRNAQLNENQIDDIDPKKSVTISMQQSQNEDSDDVSDSESLSIDKELEAFGSPLKRKKTIIRRGKLCAGFEKEKKYLLLCFRDQDDETQDEETGSKRDPEKGSNVHYIDFTEYLEQYGNQYNINSEEFLSMLHYICQQLRNKMTVNYVKKTILIDVLDDNEIYVFQPKSKIQWLAYFIKIDNQHSKLKRFYSETDEQFLNKQRKEINKDKDNKIFATDFEKVQLGDTSGYIYSYIDRPNCNLVICFLVFQRVKFDKIKSIQYEHSVFLSKVYQTLGTFQQSDDSKFVINQTVNHFKQQLQPDPVLNWLHVPDRRNKQELNKTQIQEDYRFLFQTKMTYEAGSTDIQITKRPFGVTHEACIIKLQKWIRRRLKKLKFIFKLRESIRKKYIVLYRGRQYDRHGVLLRLQVLESVYYPKVYWIAIEQINCICLNEDGIKLNATHDLSKSLALEISEDQNPWKYFQVSYKNNTIDMKQQQLFWKKLEFHGYAFIVIIYRHFEPERTQVQLRSDKELNPDFEFKKGEYITPSIARAIIKSPTPEDHFLVRPVKQEFRLVDPAIKNRSAIKIQRFIRQIFEKLKARQERQVLIKHRKQAVQRIQVYYNYYKWRVNFWAERVVEYKFLQYSQSLMLKKQFLIGLNEAWEKFKFRRQMALKIWILLKYIKWQKAWKARWMAKRNGAATRIQIYTRYYIWKKDWVKKYIERKRQQGAKRIQIYVKYKIWRKRWHIKYIYKRNRAAQRIQVYWKYKKWQVQWKDQWRKKRFMAVALLTSMIRAWFLKRKKAARKVSNWGKNMLVKIKTKKEIGWEGLKREQMRKLKATKIQRQFRRYLYRKKINQFMQKKKNVRKNVREYFAACRIQRSYRKKFQKRKIARDRLRKLIKMVLKINREKNQKLSKIGRNIAARKIQQHLRKRNQELKEENRRRTAAIKIQRWSRKIIKRIREKRYGEKKTKSIIRIQRFYKRRYKQRCQKSNRIKRWLRRKKALKQVKQKYNEKFNKLYYYIQTVLLPFIIENPEEEEKQEEEEKEVNSQNQEEKEEIQEIQEKKEEPQQKQEEEKHEQGDIVMKEQMFHFIIHRNSQFVDRYQGGVESLQQPYFNTTQTKLSRCITYFFAHKLQQVKIFPYKEKLSQPNIYFDIDVEKKNGGVSRKLKMYVAVITIQQFFRTTLQNLLRKGIMCYPKGDFQLIQEVTNPLFIFEKQFGFTVSFSFMPQKDVNKKHVMKLDQFFGNKLQFGMNYDEELTVVYKTRTQRQKMFSIRKIRYGLEYHCTLVYILESGGIYDLRLYINGTMEGQTSMRQSDRMKLPNTFEYIGGQIYNELVMTKSISPREVYDLYIERIYVLEYKWFNYSKMPQRKRYLRGITKTKKQEPLKQTTKLSKYGNLTVQANKSLTGKFFQQTGKKAESQNESFFSQISFTSEKREEMRKEKISQQIRQNLTTNKFTRNLGQEILKFKEKILIFCQILSPAVGGEGVGFECLSVQLTAQNIKNSLEGEYVIEIERFFQVLQNCEIQTTLADLGELAMLTKTLKTFKYTDDKEDKTHRYTGVFYYKIINVLRDILQPHQTQQNQNPHSSKSLQQQQQQSQKEIELPEIPDEWNKGTFEVGMTHCTRCNFHQLTGRHEEIEFVEVFNDIGRFLKEAFPNVVIKGNQIKPTKMEQFDIYIRGINSKNLLDVRPNYLYRKNGTMQQFLQNYTKKLVNVFDALVFMSFKFMEYSEEMGQFQQMMFENNQKVLPGDYKSVHDHPHQLTEEQTKVIIEEKSKRCKYWKKEDANYFSK